MIRFKNTAVLALLFICCHSAYGQTCESLVREANKMYEAGKFSRAKTLYQQAINCGNKDFVSGCQEKIKIINGITAKPQKSVPFGVSDSEITIAYQGGDKVVNIKGNGSWRVTVDSNWCKVKKENGYIIISSSENEALEDRIATVNVYSGSKMKTVKVINEGAPEMLRSSADNVSFPSEGETTTVDINANTNWDVVQAPSWVKVNKGSGKIILTAQANDQNQIRQDSLKIQSPSKSIIIINIYQGAGAEHLSFSKNDIHFGPDGGDEYVKVYTDAADWKFGDFPHWCQITRINEDSIRIHCAPNEPINMLREASVNVTTGNQMLGINVSQDAKPMVTMVPSMGIGGRAVSFGFSAGYVIPNISASSGGSFTGSVVNYALGGNTEEASYSTSGGFSFGAYADIRLYRNIYLIAGLNFVHYKYENKFYSNAVRNVITGSSDYYLRGKIQDSDTEDYTFSTLDIPILASYRFPINKRSHIQINAGPVISIGLSAKMNFSGNSDGEGLSAYTIENNQMTYNEYLGIDVKSYHIKSSGEFNLFKNHVDYTETYVEQNNALVRKSQDFEASPLKRINYGVRLGVAYELNGISLGIEYNLIFSNMANKRYWESKRWTVFDQQGSVLMSGYKQYNNYLQIKLGYTFRY